MVGQVRACLSTPLSGRQVVHGIGLSLVMKGQQTDRHSLDEAGKTVLLNGVPKSSLKQANMNQRGSVNFRQGSATKLSITGRRMSGR